MNVEAMPTPSTPVLAPGTPGRPLQDSSVRVLFVGDAQVGKTTVVHTLAGCAGAAPPLPSIGVDYRHVRVTTVQGVHRLVLVDLPGQERYRALTRMSFKNADVICLVYAADRPDTLASLKHTWLARDIPRDFAGPVQFILVRIHHFASSVDYLAVHQLVEDIRAQCAAITGGEEPEHVAVTMGAAWDVRKLSGSIVRAYGQVVAARANPAASSSITTAATTTTTTTEDVTSLDLVDPSEGTHFLSGSKRANGTASNSSRRGGLLRAAFAWCARYCKCLAPRK